MASPLDLALEEAADRFRREHPKAKALHERACEVLPGGNTRSVLYTAPFPIRIERGEGARLFDVDGHQYVDFVGELSSPVDVQKADKRLRALLFLDLLDEGLFIAERGLLALSLAITDDDCARLSDTVRRFVEARRPLL